MRDLCGFFGIFYLSQQLDNVITFKDESLDLLKKNQQFWAAIGFIEAALLI